MHSIDHKVKSIFKFITTFNNTKILPGSNGLIVHVPSCMFRLALMMPAPASPNPTRNREVIFSNVLSSSIISYSPVRVRVCGSVRIL